MKKRKRKNIAKTLCKKFIVLIALLILCKFAISFFPRTANIDRDWNLILVNRFYQIPNDYEMELTKLSNGKQVDVRIYDSLMKMISDGAS